jgi:hypothetical protein
VKGLKVMRKIKIKEMVKFLENYLGKQIEIGVSPLWSIQTYHHFNWTEIENTIMFYDAGDKERQEIVFDKDAIVEIILSEEKDIYESTISIVLKDNRIDFCISSIPVKCFKCHRIIEEPYDTKWSIQGIGGYGSKFENDKLNIPVCDNCLYYEILEYKDGQFDE